MRVEGGPGARNQSTEAWRDHITKRYGSPLEVLAQMSTAPIEELARQLNCSRLDAFVQKRHAAEALAGYIHPKLSAVTLKPPPQTLTVEGELAHLVNVTPWEEDAAAERVREPEDLVVIAETGETDHSVEAIVTNALDTLLGLAADPVAGPMIRQKLAGLKL